jgi:hypothetical protein
MGIDMRTYHLVVLFSIATYAYLFFQRDDKGSDSLHECCGDVEDQRPLVLNVNFDRSCDSIL